MLSLADIDVSYGQTPILREVSFDVNEGSIVSLIGRNGVGKTTLMKTVIGLLTPTNGVITFEDQDVTPMGADARARLGIGYVPQGRDVFPRLTVKENLRVGEQVNDDTTEYRYEEVYEFFPRLEERKNQKAGTMSGGEQQMLAIGRALVGNPDLLLLDEPSEGVQPNIVSQIGETLVDIRDRLGTTIFFVEQNLEFTVNTSERAYVMEKGTVVDDLKSGDLMDSDVVQKYIAI
ncbi:ABC transporter ATP-binding protein [Haladaptatus sp. CMSO5]|uniref:ABC transporter ATP-binding protein n=1 Tax=Haladaptatus sp. CMSO5 TaxID=3120514 RepID=UPI003FA52C49